MLWRRCKGAGALQGGQAVISEGHGAGRGCIHSAQWRQVRPRLLLMTIRGGRGFKAQHPPYEHVLCVTCQTDFICKACHPAVTWLWADACGPANRGILPPHCFENSLPRVAGCHLRKRGHRRSPCGLLRCHNPCIEFKCHAKPDGNESGAWMTGGFRMQNWADDSQQG